MGNEIPRGLFEKTGPLRKYLAGGVALGLLILFEIIMNPPSWLLARYDLMFVKKFSSSEGKFSMEIPKSWRQDGTAKIRLGGGDNTYLSVRGEVTRRSRRRRLMYADMTVAMTTLPPDRSIPSAAELGEELNADLAARREVRGQFEERLGDILPEGIPGATITGTPSNTRFEVERIKGYQWAKTTLTIGRETFIFCQAVDGRSNHYTVTFATDNISHYGPIFENMMKSFTFN